MRVAGQAATGDRGLLVLRCVALFEDHKDHAELMIEAITARLPGVRVAWPPDAADLGMADAVLLALSTDPRAVRRVLAQAPRVPPLVVVGGAGTRWTDGDLDALRPHERLDKRQGFAFLERLPEALARAAEAAPPAAAPPARSGAPDETPRRPAAAAEAADQRFTEAVAHLLSRSLDQLLSDTRPLLDLVRARRPEDPALARYVGSLEREIGRARAVARRLGAIVRASGAPPRVLQAGPFVGLRLPAWEMLAPSGTAVRFAAAADTPRVEIRAEMLGWALDDIVAALLSDAAPGSRLCVEVDTLVAGAGAAGRAGPRAGRYARIALFIELPKETALVAAAPETRRMQRALAATKEHEGFLELQQIRGSTTLVRADVLLPPHRPRRATAKTGPPAVLLVDDEEQVRRIAGEMLRSDGLVVAEAPAGEDAVALYRAGCRYDAVLLDLAMGGMNGLATFRAIREIDPGAAIVLVSGSVGAATLRELLDEGLLGFVPKPFRMRQLLDTVRAGLGAAP